ncbi:MAG: 2-dehydropantoate 2-reductase [Spirochaetes bacterium ADurb.Bin215]|jgi:2-dehydropantoate 2-reductase|nr:MAG: 2-dehydropantoate 2-reductase [Spirochaetes bacterium ADurb.Bin215]
MREVIAVAAPEGVTLTEKDIEDSFRVLDGLSDEGKTSMCQDVEAGRKTEVELFSRTVMDLGEKHGISVPINTLMYRLIRAIENTY